MLVKKGRKVGNPARINANTMLQANDLTRQLVWEAMTAKGPTAGDVIRRNCDRLQEMWSAMGFPLIINDFSLNDMLISLNNIHRAFTEFKLETGYFAVDSAVLTTNIAQSQWNQVVAKYSSILTHIGKGVDIARRNYMECCRTNQQLESLLSRLNNKIALDANTARAREEDYQTALARLKEAEMRKNELASKMDKLKKRHDGMINQLKRTKKETRQTLREYEKEIEALRQEVDDVSLLYQQDEEEKARLDTIINNAEIEIKNLSKDRADVLKLLNADSNWNGTLATLVQYVLQVQKETGDNLLKLQTDYNNLNDKYAENLDKLKQYGQELEQSKQNCEDKIKELEVQKNAYDQLKLENDFLKADVDSLKDVRTYMQNQKEEYKRQIAQLAKDKDGYDEALKLLDQQNTAIKRLEADIETKNKEISQKDSLIQKQENDINSYKGQILSLSLEKDELQRLMDGTSAQYEDLANRFNDLQHQAEQAQLESGFNALAVAANGVLQDQAEQMIAQLRQQNLTLSAENANLLSSIPQNVRRIRELEIEAEDNRALIANLREQIRAKEDDIANLLAGQAEIEPQVDVEMVEVGVGNNVPIPLENQQGLLNVGGPVAHLEPRAPVRAPARVPAGVPPRVPARARGRPNPVPAPERRANVIIAKMQEDDPLSSASKRARNSGSGGYVVGGRPDPNLSSAGAAFWKNVYNSNYRLF